MKKQISIDNSTEDQTKTAATYTVIIDGEEKKVTIRDTFDPSQSVTYGYDHFDCDTDETEEEVMESVEQWLNENNYAL